MASHSRGKLKEKLQGIHNNCNWIRDHCKGSIVILNGHHPEIRRAFELMGELAQMLDDSACELYGKI